jgi:hypothetical protein
MTKEILQELIISEEDLLAEAVAKAKSLFAIEGKTGRVIVRVPRTSISARGLIGLHLTGHYFSHQMGKASSPSMSPSELSAMTGVEPSTVSARLTELVDAGSVQKTGKAEFAINPYLMNDFLDEISAAREKPSVPEVGAPSSEAALASGQDVESSYPDIGKFESVTDAIIHLLRGPFGRTPRDWGEIQRVLRHNSMLFSDGSITGTLSLLWKSKRLRRVKEGRSFKYQLVGA